MDRTREEHRAYVRARAAEDFGQHAFTVEGEGRWYCGKPGTGICSFRVIAAPGAILLYGDIFALVLCMSERDPMPWLRSVLRSERYDVNYLLGKAEHKAREFLRPEAERFLRELRDEGHADLAARAGELWRNDGGYDGTEAEQQHAWNRACYEAGVDDPPACDDWTFQMLFQAEALRRFVKLLAGEGGGARRG